MREMLRRAASVFLAFSIVISTGMPVRAQEETDIPAQTIAVEEEIPEKSEAGEAGVEKPKGEEISPETEDPPENGITPEVKNPEEGAGVPESDSPDNGQTPPIEELPDDVTVSENTTAPEEETVSENTVLPAEGSQDTDDILAFDADSRYAMVAQSDGLAVSTTAIGWANRIKASAAYYKDSNKVTDENAQLIITPASSPDVADESITAGDNEVVVRIENLIDGEKYPFRVETSNDYAFADADRRYDKKQEIYLIKKTGADEGILQAASNNRYATIDNGELRFNADTTEVQAEKFLFAKNPGILDSTIQIEHKASGKYIKTYQRNGLPLTVDGNSGDEGTSFSEAVFDSNSVDTVDGLTFITISLISKDYGNGVGSVFWDSGQTAQEVKSDANTKGNGWETLRILGNGDGTVSFKDSCFDQYITVKDNKLMCGQLPRETTKEDLTDNDKFILHTELTPLPASGLTFDSSSRTQTTVDLFWENPRSLFTGIEIWQKKADEEETAYQKVGETGSEEQYTATDLEKDTEYQFKIRPVLVNGSGEDREELYGEYSDVISVKTRILEKPHTPENIRIEERNGNLVLSWDAVENITGYQVYEASGIFSEYVQTGDEIPAAVPSLTEEPDEVLPDLTAETDDTDPALTVRTGGTDIATKAETAAAGRVETELPPGAHKYDYYRITAVRTDTEGTEESDQSAAVSLETAIFGDHTIFLSPDDDVRKVDRLLKDLFDKQNDYSADAQFKGEQWQVYFKPGDYTETSCMYLGFYTSFNGLGKTPYDVKLNNIAIPAYLPGGELGGTENNATCNFWRSAENLSVIATGNEQGKAKYGADSIGRGDIFNWAVAQAAPLRRVYSTRPVHYDWNYGWASGGYVADCLITGKDGDNSAGTWSGQQFFTRNSEIEGNTFGTTLNNFFMGVEAANNLTSETGKPLRKGNGYTNWGIRGATSKDDFVGGQQVVTEITNTPEISEKPFLYLDNDEYKVFVPAVRENTRGISWGEGQANDGMGEGTSLSLDRFYIAKPSDTAAKINQEIADGKNIYFTPGIYHAETPIVVDRENAILLGTGMTSIIPDNGEMAMHVGDQGGIRIEGLIFDAGVSSRLLLQVGTKGTHTDHSNNPIILQDLFFRVGGTTDVLTKADDALEINSDDVIGDHFWIWRADHGAGVEWYGNESKHGLIVNGDRVRCYALFNEHFQEYHTLWNGEDGETYFYQNETCYDPISQEAWMSHNGTVKGYSSYKVSNDVENHYAAGLGVYNVFIYTGKTYDGKGTGIQLDNAIEVPNKPGVMVENACTQTFANDKKTDGSFYPLSSINHIINGIGGIVSSGMSTDLVRGESWSRKFVLYYHNGEAEYGKEPDRSTFVYDVITDADKEKKPYDQRGKFIGTEIVTVEAPADEEVYLDRISKLYNQFSDKTEDDYTANSWKRADMANVLRNAKSAIDEGTLIKAEIASGTHYSQAEISALQTKINKACTILEAASEKLVYIGKAVWQQEKYRDYSKDNYTQNSWNAFEQARVNLNQVLEKADLADPATTKDVYLLQLEIDGAYEALENAAAKLVPVRTIAVTGIALNRESLSIRKGNVFQLMAVMRPADATNQAVKWSSSDEKTVFVDQTGKITALEQGTAEITVTTEDGGYTAVCVVSVAADASTEEPDEPDKPDEPAPPVSKDQLRQLISQCKSLNRNDYTVESWDAFSKALSDAEETARDENVTQKEVEEAVANLSRALEQLIDRDGLWAFDIPDITYTGKAVKPSITVYNGRTLLVQGKDYTVSYKNNTKVTETAQTIIKGKGNYGGSFTKTFRIVPKNLAETDILIPDLYVKAPKAGKSVTPVPVVTRNGKKLSKKEYTVGNIRDRDGNTINQITAPGIYTVEVSGVPANGYNGARTIQMTVAGSEQVLMSAVKVTGIKNKPYTGSIIEPEFTVKYGTQTLTPGVDYQIHCNSVEIGTANAIITGTGTKYVGEKSVTFKITGTPIKANNVTLDATEAVYTGSAITPAVNVTGAESGRDYTVEYDKNINTGNAVVLIKGIGKYTGTVKKNFKIAAFDVKENAGGKFSYNKDALTAPYAKGGSRLAASDLGVTFNGISLKEGIDYTLVYASNQKTGIANVKIEGRGNFKGTTEPVNFTVLQQDLPNLTDISATDVLEKHAKNYNRVVPVIKDLDGKPLKKGTDFVVTGYTQTDGSPFETVPAVGDTVRVTVEAVGTGNYKGSTFTDFRVIRNNSHISKAAVRVNPQSYTGKAVELTETDPVSGEKQIIVTMKVNGETKTLVEGTDYEIVKTGYSKNINKGTGKLVIRGINEYGGTKTVSFKINPHALTSMEWYNNLYSRAMSWFGK